MSNQICLKWNSFLNNIATSFESLWEEEGLVDVTLASDGQCLTAHKVILSASSPFFKKVFQTNPCQHPVIILQDVHFRELEALLIFIYKGEVNIEQQNLPALLKAAETLKIRGLSGGDMFAKESYKRFVDDENIQSENVDGATNKEDHPAAAAAPKKKQKVNKKQQNNNSILEKALTSQINQCDNSNDNNSNIIVEQSLKEIDTPPDPVLLRLEMKTEPLELNPEDFQKHSLSRTENLDRLDTGQNNPLQGSFKPTVTVIAEARESSPSSLTTIRKEKSPPNLSTSPIHCSDNNSPADIPEPVISPSDDIPNISQPAFPTFDNNPSNNNNAETCDDPQNSQTNIPNSYPPFPCPFCDRAYTSWGFRRRHIKAVHTISPMLNCKWCLQILPTHAAWRRHVISAHNLSASDAHNGLLILEEAHMVLQIVHPTRLDTLVNMIKQSSQQSRGSGQDNNGAQGDKDND